MRMFGKKSRLGVGIVTSPFLLKAGFVPLADLINIIAPLCNNLYVITGNAEVEAQLPKLNNLEIFLVERNQEPNQLLKIAKYIKSNLQITYKIMRLSSKTTIWFFYLGERPLLIPLLTARLIRKKTVFIASGTLIKIKEEQSSFIVMRLITNLLTNINHAAANKIVIPSQRNINEKDLVKYEDKIIIANKHYIDLNQYVKHTRVSERANLVGYIGRLSHEKGILNFLEAIAKVLKVRGETRFIIGGDGPLQTNVEQYLKNNNLNEKVNFIGWIPHEDIQKFLGQLKLLVIPSYTETGPNIAFEAIGCGTPVLATPVGLIPDIIIDGETGFITENNSPDCIARNIIKALKCPDLEKFAQNSRKLVEKEFSYEKAAESYMHIFSELNIGTKNSTR